MKGAGFFFLAKVKKTQVMVSVGLTKQPPKLKTERREEAAPQLRSKFG